MMAHAAPGYAQTPAGRPGLVRALTAETGLIGAPPARATASFGAGAELGRASLPGALRLGLAAWIADVPGDRTAHGRELTALWQVRSPLGLGGIRLLAAAGTGLAWAGMADSAGSAVRLAAIAQTGLRVPLAPAEALALELRASVLALPGHSPQRALRLALRYAPRARAALATGENRLAAESILAEPAPQLPDLYGVVAVAGGLLDPGVGPGVLRLESAAFDSGAALRPDAFTRLARAGAELRRLRATAVRIFIFGSADGSDEHGLASRRAVSVARALAHGGYPLGGMDLQVTAGPAPPDVAGRIVALRGRVNVRAVPGTHP